MAVTTKDGNCAERATGLKVDIQQTKEAIAHVYDVTGLQKHPVSR